ncbi:MAG: PEP-CTERM sorting domain-containing protein [Planctomycetia bacterium]|nr:PEP-CTERM sorting domain-containing protein [Planctomycetia bacterium]
MKRIPVAVCLRGWLAFALIVGLVASASVVQASPPLAIETWSDGTTAGWDSVGSNLFSDNPGSGGNPGGWLRGVRGANPIFQMDGSDGIFNGNYGTMYGTSLTIGYDVRVEDGGISIIRMELRNPAATTDWRYEWNFSANPLVPANGWTSLSAPINTAWSDAQAFANGWTEVAGSGTWASVLADVGSLSYLVTITQGAPPPVGSTAVTGIDNFAIYASNLVPGDINGDGQVNLTDYGILKSYWLQTVSGGVSVGDLNNDNTVNIIDFATFKQDYIAFNGGNGSDLVAVPEPSAMTMLLSACGLPAWLIMRRRKSS